MHILSCCTNLINTIGPKLLYSSKRAGGDKMAVVANQADSKFKLVLNAGVDENNKDIIKNKTFSNVKSTVTNENLYNLGVALSGLQSYALTDIVRYEEYKLINEV